MWSSTTKVYKTKETKGISYKESMRYLLERFEDAAWINADLNGFGARGKDYGWFLIKYSLSFDEKIDLSYMDVKTWPYFSGAVSCGRAFEMRNSLGVKLIEADSLWGLVDLRTEKILSPYKVFNIDPELASKDNPKKFIFPRLNFSIDNKSCYAGTYIDVNNHSMIDKNNHVNNTNYIVFLLDPIDEKFYTTNYIKHIDIHYKKQILYGSRIHSVFEYNSLTNTTTHSIMDCLNGQIYCIAQILWNKRPSVSR